MTIDEMINCMKGGMIYKPTDITCKSCDGTGKKMATDNVIELKIVTGSESEMKYFQNTCLACNGLGKHIFVLNKLTIG